MISGRCEFKKEWNDWDIDIHKEKEQINRQGRSMTYPFSFKINKRLQTAKFSSTTDLPYYKTSLKECTCYDFQGRHLPCKHIYRLAVELGIIEIINRNSIALGKERLEEIKNSGDIDSMPEQLDRQKRAGEKKCSPASIDYRNKTAVFVGSGKKPYETTIDSCTCRDFILRRLPCKHIYRLRFELNEEVNYLKKNTL